MRRPKDFCESVAPLLRLNCIDSCIVDPDSKNAIESMLSYQWKFVQDIASGAVRIIPRVKTSLVLAVDGSGNAVIEPWAGSSHQMLISPFPSTH